MKINICGDFTTVGKGYSAIEAGTAISDDIIALFKNSDFNILNLESPVITDNTKAIKKSGPNLYTSEEAIKYIKSCGVNLVTLANNHFYDYGMHGIEKTLESLKKYQIDYVGGGINKDEYSKIFYIEKDAIRVAILNYCESEFSVTGICGSNPINPINVYRDIQKAKINSDFIIVICHGGHEGYNLPSPRMKKLYRFFIEIGADIVCNHHQHCFSGYEEYKNGVIFYGLGNFFFYDHRPQRRQSSLWNYGYIVSLNITQNKINYDINSYVQCRNNVSTKLLNETEKKTFLKNLYDLSLVIMDDDRLNDEFNKWCRTQSNNILTMFSPYNNRLFMALCRRGLLPKFLSNKKIIQLYNTIRCESHNDLSINILKQYM